MKPLSKDGQWRSFPKVPCLLQYVSNGNYYGRIRVNSKLIRVSLKTKVWTTAKLRLTDLQKDQRENINKVDPPKFSEAVEMFKKESVVCHGEPERNLALTSFLPFVIAVSRNQTSLLLERFFEARLFSQCYGPSIY